MHCWRRSEKGAVGSHRRSLNVEIEDTYKTPKWMFASVKVDQWVFTSFHRITGEEESLHSHMKDYEVRR